MDWSPPTLGFLPAGEEDRGVGTTYGISMVSAWLDPLPCAGPVRVLWDCRVCRTPKQSEIYLWSRYLGGTGLV